MTNKPDFIAMLREQSLTFELASRAFPHCGDTYRQRAAEWRALREALEGLVKAAEAISQGAEVTGHGDEFIISAIDLLILDAALKKVRQE